MLCRSRAAHARTAMHGTLWEGDSRQQTRTVSVCFVPGHRHTHRPRGMDRVPASWGAELLQPIRLSCRLPRWCLLGRPCRWRCKPWRRVTTGFCGSGANGGGLDPLTQGAWSSLCRRAPGPVWPTAIPCRFVCVPRRALRGHPSAQRCSGCLAGGCPVPPVEAPSSRKRRPLTTHHPPPAAPTCDKLSPWQRRQSMQA